LKRRYILSIDQGTTGSRAFIFDESGKIVTSAYQEFEQYFPQPGWVEHDAEEIWSSCVSVIKKATTQAKIQPSQILAIGITNQRETTILWERKTARPVYHAIVWQCRRTSPMCASKELQSVKDIFRRKTGLVMDAYFSGTKIRWLLDHVPGLRAKAERGEICFGTVDSWLIWKLTGGKVHATDYTNASRTLIFNIQKLQWDDGLLKILKIPSIILPRPMASGGHFGRTVKGVAGLTEGIPIAAVMGDQQAALYGHGCYEPGTIKNTYGTGCFLVLNTGNKLIYSKGGLLSTVAADDRGQPLYAMEGSVFIAGAVIQWLRDQLRVLKKSADSEKLVHGLKDTKGVYFVPAFVGLGAPYWDGQARGSISGLTRGANVKHIVRAALESIAYQTKDVFDLMQKESHQTIRTLKVDGGACKNNFLMQFQANILGCKIVRPRVIESTAQGVAYLAGITMGVWKGKEDLKRLQRVDKVFTPRMKQQERKELYEGWLTAVEKTRTKIG